MENIPSLFDMSQKTAAQLTTNPFLQDIIETLLSLKNYEERRVFENGFWARTVSLYITSCYSCILFTNHRKISKNKIYEHIIKIIIILNMLENHQAMKKTHV